MHRRCSQLPRASKLCFELPQRIVVGPRLAVELDCCRWIRSRNLGEERLLGAVEVGKQEIAAGEMRRKTQS